MNKTDTQKFLMLRSGRKLPLYRRKTIRRLRKVMITDEDEAGCTVISEEGQSTRVEGPIPTEMTINRKADHFFIPNREYMNLFRNISSEEEKKLVIDNFALIYEKRHIILSDSRMFLVRSPHWVSVFFFFLGYKIYCLGSLLESWELGSRLVRKEKESGLPVCIIGGAGNLLNGNHYLYGWSPQDRDLVSIRLGERTLTDKRKVDIDMTKIHDIHREIQFLSENYPEIPDAESMSVHELVRTLKSMDN